MTTASEKTQPADEGRLEPTVRPVAYVQRMGSYQGVPHYGCLLTIEAEQRMKVNDPLYGRAELDAAVAAERERWAKECVGLAKLSWAAADQPYAPEVKMQHEAVAAAMENLARDMRA